MTRDEFMDKLEGELAARRVPELPYWCGVPHGLARLGLVPIIAPKHKSFRPPFTKGGGVQRRRLWPRSAERGMPLSSQKRRRGARGGPSPGVPPYYRAHRSKKLARLL